MGLQSLGTVYDTLLAEVVGTTVPVKSQSSLLRSASRRFDYGLIVARSLVCLRVQRRATQPVSNLQDPSKIKLLTPYSWFLEYSSCVARAEMVHTVPESL